MLTVSVLLNVNVPAVLMFGAEKLDVVEIEPVEIEPVVNAPDTLALPATSNVYVPNLFAVEGNIKQLLDNIIPQLLLSVPNNSLPSLFL